MILLFFLFFLLILLLLFFFFFSSRRRHTRYIGDWSSDVCSSDLKLARGEWIGAFGLTEAGSGSDPGAMQSRARKSKTGFVLSGSKTWITHAPVADVLLVWAKLDDRIRGFILERADKGLTTPKIEGKFSLRASVTGEIAMNDIEIPEDRMLPAAEGLKAPFDCLNQARYGIAWGAMGAAEFCWHAARNYGLE